MLGHPVTIFMPDWMSAERKQLIAGFGADIVGVSREEGGFLGAIRMAKEFAATSPGTFLPRQFTNQANVEAHASTTGPEIWLQLAEAGLRPDAFAAGVGTGGTVMGVGRYLARSVPPCAFTPWSPPNRRRCLPATRSAAIAFKASPTSSFLRL
jgi:cysteine synthase A